MAGLVAKSQREVAATLGINRVTFADWQAEGCPGVRGNYVMCEIINWARENKWGNDDAYIDSIEDKDLKEEAIRLKNEKTCLEIEKLEINNKRTLRKLVDVGEFVRLQNAKSAIFRTGLERLQKQKILTGPEALEIVIDVLDEISNELQEA